MMSPINRQLALLTTVIVVIVLISMSAARPHIRTRRSGISDQRLAELETLVALSKLRENSKASRAPIAYGLIDIEKIGKRKRSPTDRYLRDQLVPFGSQHEYRDSFRNGRSTDDSSNNSESGDAYPRDKTDISDYKLRQSASSSESEESVWEFLNRLRGSKDDALSESRRP